MPTPASKPFPYHASLLQPKTKSQTMPYSPRPSYPQSPYHSPVFQQKFTNPKPKPKFIPPLMSLVLDPHYARNSKPCPQVRSKPKSLCNHCGALSISNNYNNGLNNMISNVSSSVQVSSLSPHDSNVSSKHPTPVTLEDIAEMSNLKVKFDNRPRAPSDSGATYHSLPETGFDGELFPCRYRIDLPRTQMKLPITIETQFIYSLVDTGADISAVSYSLYLTLSKSLHRTSKCPTRIISLSVEDKPSHSVDTVAEIVVSLKGRKFMWKFYVIPQLSTDVILGLDFLAAYKVEISIPKQTLTFGVPLDDDPPNFVVPPIRWDMETPASDLPTPTSIHTSDLYGTPSTVSSLPCKNIKLHILHAVTLEPRTMHRVAVNCHDVSIKDAVVVPNKSVEVAKCIVIGRSIVTFSKGMSHIYVSNLSLAPVRLYKAQTIAELDVLDATDVVMPFPNFPQKDKKALKTLTDMGRLLSPDFRTPRENDFAHGFDFPAEPEKDLVQFQNSISLTQPQVQLKALLIEYADIFSTDPIPLGTTHLAKHYIETGDALPICQRPYRVSPAERREIARICDDLLDKDMIEFSHSPWSSPIVLVPKKDGKLRFCVDYRKLNAVSKKDRYPLPRIDDALDRLKGSSVFSTLDCDQAYYQVPMNEADREKTAFVTPDGLYQWKVMAFGLCNAPATYSRLVDRVLGPLKWTTALAYLDDIVVFTPDFPSHLQSLRLVFDALRAAKMKLKPSKCEFAQPQIKYLGHIVSKEGVHVNPDTVRAVSEFPRPCDAPTKAQKIKKVQSFVSLCSYYRRFIKGFSTIAKPLTRLTQKDVDFVWDSTVEDAFQTLKQKLLSPPILGFPDEHSPTIIHSDASHVGLGATLVQMQNGVETVISYASRVVSKDEAKYPITELEMLAVIFAIEHFRPYLYGRRFQVVVDHCGLCNLLRTVNPVGRLARWILRLQPYDFEIVYKSGRKHNDADGLSRNPVPLAVAENPLALDDDMFALHLRELSDLSAFGREELIQLQQRDPHLKPLIDAALNPPDTVPLTKVLDCRLSDFAVRNGILYKASCDENNPNPWLLCVPKPLRLKVLQSVHEQTLNHLGFLRTYSYIKSRYFWPHMYSHCRRFVMCCRTCQFFNRRNFPTPGALQPVPPPKVPFETVGIDFQGPFPMTSPGRNVYILVVIDHLTRYVESVPTRNIDSHSAIAALKKILILRHGPPKNILTDQGTCFHE